MFKNSSIKWIRDRLEKKLLQKEMFRLSLLLQLKTKMMNPLSLKQKMKPKMKLQKT